MRHLSGLAEVSSIQQHRAVATDALFSVVGLSVPPIIGVLREQDANLHEAIISGRAGSLQEGPEYAPALCVDLLITNFGKLPGVVKAVAVKLKDDNTWNYDTVLFDKQRDDAQGATAETSAIINPSQSRIIEVKRRAGFGQMEKGMDFQVRIESLRFDMQTRSVELRGVIR